MGSPSVEELYETCSGADDGPWRQGEVLQGSRVKLENGFECTKESPTSVPTTQEESSFMRCRSARAGEELESDDESTVYGRARYAFVPDELRSAPSALSQGK